MNGDGICQSAQAGFFIFEAEISSFYNSWREISVSASAWFRCRVLRWLPKIDGEGHSLA